MPTPKGGKAWNSGKGTGWTDKRGYRWRSITTNGQRVTQREHRYIMGKHLGRDLEPWELVHHKDGDRLNNAIENLEIKEWGTHTAEHHNGSRKSEDARRSMEAFALMRGTLRRERKIKDDLLAALKAMVGEIRKRHQTFDARIFVDAERAIAKAEGDAP